MNLCFESNSRRKDKISDTRLACSVGVNLLGSNIDMVSSFATSSGFLYSLPAMVFGDDAGTAGEDDGIGGGDDDPPRDVVP